MSTKKLKLISLKPEEYPDLEIECQEIVDMKAFVEYYMQELAQKGEYPLDIIIRLLYNTY